MLTSHNVYSRVGLLGNPSDGFGGKTIAVEVRDFWASATIWESPRLHIVPHPVFDPFVFTSLRDLRNVACEDGYYGGTRLIYATCKHFFDYCEAHGIPLNEANFTIQYDTNIPRQVGLGGSSAIVVAALKCLLDFFQVTDEQIPKPLQPQLALSVEKDELEIQAGLQDRVAQVYGGLVYMDFNPQHLQRYGHGIYEPLTPELLPPLYLAHIPCSTMTSGKAHNLIRYRFDNGDPEVIAAMQEFAGYAEEGRRALEAHDYAYFAELMDRNFDLRRHIYRDEVIGARNLEMVEIARGFGLPAKFAGSGGAIIGVCEDEERAAACGRAFEQAGFRFRTIDMGESKSASPEGAAAAGGNGD